MCLCIKDLQELVEAREQECVRLRRQLKELKNTVSLRRFLTQGRISSDLLSWHGTEPLLLSPESLELTTLVILT